MPPVRETRSELPGRPTARLSKNPPTPSAWNTALSAEHVGVKGPAHAVGFEGAWEVCVVDACPGELSEEILHGVEIARKGLTDPVVIFKCPQCVHRECRDRVLSGCGRGRGRAARIGSARARIPTARLVNR